MLSFSKRRPFRLAAVLLALGAVVGVPAAMGASPKPADPRVEWDVEDQPGFVPPEGSEKLQGPWEKQIVFFRSNEAPGTIVVHTDEKFLYLVQPNNRAIRYGIGVGREGFLWKGLVAFVRKQEWPDWRPPPEMIQRQPYLPRFMAGGPGNPMGARAMYLGGTVYRIHGTNMPETIGSNVSSGCFRLVNPDVIDLYERVPVGTKVIVRQAATL
jgi:lipoprotein-anchoring transpeptidase ErfK/SrfK